jgi:hypothetical protein
VYAIRVYLWLKLDPAAKTVELCAFFDDQCGSSYLSFDVGGAAEDELFAGENVAFNGSIDLRDRDFDYGFSNFRSGADDQRPVLRDDIPGEVAVDSQHRFELHFASEIHHVAHETKPIIFVDIGLMAINEPGLAAFVSARNCLSSHWLLPF